MDKTSNRMSASAAWLFGMGAVIAAGLVNFGTTKAGISTAICYVLYTVIFAVAGYLAVGKTGASTGGGVVVGLVSAVGMFVVTYALLKMQLSDELAKQHHAVAGLDREVAAGVGSAVGSIGGTVAGIFAFVWTFLSMMVGAIVGGRSKSKSTPAVVPVRIAA